MFQLVEFPLHDIAREWDEFHVFLHLLFTDSHHFESSQDVQGACVEQISREFGKQMKLTLDQKTRSNMAHGVKGCKS